MSSVCFKHILNLTERTKTRLIEALKTQPKSPLNPSVLKKRDIKASEKKSESLPKTIINDFYRRKIHLKDKNKIVITLEDVATNFTKTYVNFIKDEFPVHDKFSRLFFTKLYNEEAES